jgi:hypothetical protein
MAQRWPVLGGRRLGTVRGMPSRPARPSGGRPPRRRRTRSPQPEAEMVARRPCRASARAAVPRIGMTRAMRERYPPRRQQEGRRCAAGLGVVGRRARCPFRSSVAPSHRAGAGWSKRRARAMPAARSGRADFCVVPICVFSMVCRYTGRVQVKPKPKRVTMRSIDGDSERSGGECWWS